MLRASWLLLLLISSASLARASSYRDELVGEARRLELSSNRYWRKLVHYRERRAGGARSEAHGDGFLLAKDGVSDPRAELEATLSAFFEPAPVGDEQHPQCRFVARYRWLDEQLHFDASRLPPRPCPAFDAWYRTVNPDRVTLVFASAYLNNPASMYGHTLLRIDQPGGDDSDALVAYALNYAASTDETSGIVFAFLGITGGYLGEFSLLPYYDKVKEYGDLESRDLWEYELALTRAETDRILWHFWELRGVGFRYYFFLQNCSYRLLELLELSRPGLELTDAFRFRAIPTDTVREVLKTQGLLRFTRFRPGAATVLEHHLDRTPRDERFLARDLARGSLDPGGPIVAVLPPEARARVLQVAYEYLHHLLVEERVSQEIAGPRLRNLLVARSEVPHAGSMAPPAAPAIRPDQGHDTARIALGAGRRESRFFSTIRMRPAYHELLDPQGGYQENSQINFLDVEARRYADDTIEIERLDFVDIDSLTPRDAFFSPSSWNVAFGLVRQDTPARERPLVTELRGGSAWAYRLGRPGSVVAYGGWQSSLQLGHGLPRSWRLGAGPRLGLVADAGRFGRVGLEGRSLWHLDESGPEWSVRLEHRLPLSRGIALGFRVGRESVYDRTIDEAAAALYLYR